MPHFLKAVAVILVPMLILSACQRAEKTARESGNLTAEAHNETLEWGGDTQAWLTSRGSASDAGYVAARLRLPLEREPTWRFSYTAAEFSSQSVDHLLHYRGSLIVAARSSQLLLLDVMTGALTSSDAMYSFSPDTQSENEQFVGLFITPRGLLSATDDKGRIYGFDIEAGQLSTRWTTPGVDQITPLIAGPDVVVAQGSGVVRAFRPSDGTPLWNYPVGSSNFYLTLGRNGTLLWLSRRGDLRAWDVADGQAKWSVQLGVEPQFGTAAVIDDYLDVVYVLREDATMECRGLAAGELRWTYSWLHLDAGAPWGSLAERLGAAQNLNVGPDALALVLLSGDVVMLRPDGTERWRMKLDTSLAGGLLFENALLVTQFYAHPIHTSPRVEDTYNSQPPPWDNVRQYRHVLGVQAESREPQRSRRGRGIEPPTFNRMVALRLEDGAVLDAMEPPLVANSGLTPARDKIVFGGERLLADIAARAERGSRRGDGPVPRWIYAYDWLEPEMD